MPEPLSRGGEDFLLRVKGDSMINAGILDGDIVVVRRAAGRAERRDRRRARRRRRVRRRGDGQALLPRGRPHPAAARERRARADLRARTCRSSARSWGCSGAVSWWRRSTGRSTRSCWRSLRGVEPRVPRLRRVRPAPRAARSRAPSAARASCARRPTRIEAGYNSTRRPGDRGRCDAARGKSGHRRAGRWGNPRRRKPTESGTERRPPPAHDSPETPAVRVKRWGKSPPASW